MKPELRKRPEVSFYRIPPEYLEMAARFARKFIDEYRSYPGDDCGYGLGSGAYYVKATKGGNVGVWMTS